MLLTGNSNSFDSILFSNSTLEQLFFTFIFLAMVNLMGILPFIFIVTSHIIVTFCVSSLGGFTINIVSVMNNLIDRIIVLVFVYGVLGRSYLQSIVFTFFFVVMVNLFSMIFSFMFTVTSHIMPIFFWGLLIFISLNIRAANQGQSCFFTENFFKSNKLYMLMSGGVLIPTKVSGLVIQDLDIPGFAGYDSTNIAHLHPDTQYIIKLIRRQQDPHAARLDVVECYHLNDFRKHVLAGRENPFAFRLVEGDVFAYNPHGDGLDEPALMAIIRRPGNIDRNMSLSKPVAGYCGPVVDGQNNPIPPEPTTWEWLLSYIWG